MQEKCQLPAGQYLLLTSSLQLFPAGLSVRSLFSVSPGQVCAGNITRPSGPCNGDSGGPLVGLDREGRWRAVGLVSWRLAPSLPGGGCDGNTFTVFTRISHYLPWIADQMDLLPPLTF